MKKLLRKAFLVTAVLVLIISALPVCANEASGTTYIAVSNSTPAIGDTFTVSAVFNLSKEAYAVSATLRYSTKYLEFVSSDNANMVENGVIEMVNMGNSNSYTFILNFKVIASGNAEIILKDCIFADFNDEYTAAASSIVLPTKKLANTTVPSAPSISYFTKNSVELQSVENCEYSIDGETWQESTHFDNLITNSQYNFYQRFKENDTYYAGEKSAPISVITAVSDNGIFGDVDQNKTVDVADLALLKKIIAKINEPHTYESIAPDIDNSGDVPNAADLALLKKIIANLV